MAAKKGNGGYNEGSVVVLDSVEAVRQNLGMYIGSNDSHGIFQIVKEIIDNAVDEATAGFNKVVGISLNKDQITVWDQGRGIPVGANKKTGKSTLVEVFATLHAGGKKSGTAYAKGSIGTHGVGSSVTNFLSNSLDAFSFREERGGWHHVRFEKGILKQDLKKKVPPKIMGHTPKNGTVVVFYPDKSCFSKTAKLDCAQLSAYLKVLSYLVPQARFVFDNNGKVVEFQQKGGLQDYIKDLLVQNKAESIGKAFVFEGTGVKVALQWADIGEEDVRSYVNGSATKDGGTHVKGLFDALTKALEPFKGKRDYTPTDLRTGLIGVLNIALPSPDFDSQTKHRLVTESAYRQVYDEAFGGLIAFFKANKGLAAQIIKRATEIKELRQQFQASKKATAELRSTKARRLLPEKLAASTTKNPKDREIYIVEGDSAAGSAKQARDSKYQEVLALRGKIINAYGASGHKMYDNAEVLDIMRAIGFNGDNSKKLNLRVGKILFLTDADQDGKHIALLLTNLLQKGVPQAILDKMVFVVDAPLFQYSSKTGDKIFADTLEALKTKVGAKFNSANVSRLKGWGEINHKDLRTIAFNPKTRKLIRLRALPDHDFPKYLEIVGESPHGRRSLLGL